MSRRRALVLVLAGVCAAVVLAVTLVLLLGQRLPGMGIAPAQPEVTALAEPVEWDERLAPNYYQVVGEARFEELFGLDAKPEPGTVLYAPLDALGRAGRVVACVDLPLMEAGSSRKRNDMSGLHPSGWGHNEEVDIELPTGALYHGYFWNRSHLLAKSLGGQETLENLVCGTRMQNVGANLNGSEGGMAYCESLVRDWLRDHPNECVYYAVTPGYYGTELVCRTITVDLRSSNAELNCEVVVYNAAKGYEIAYADGTFRKR